MCSRTAATTTWTACPVKLLPQLVDHLAAAGHPRVAVRIEERGARGYFGAAAPARGVPAPRHRPARPVSGSEDRYAHQALLGNAAAPSSLRRHSDAARMHRARAGICCRASPPWRTAWTPATLAPTCCATGSRTSSRTAAHRTHALVRIVRLQGRHTARCGPRVRRALPAQPPLRRHAAAPHRPRPPVVEFLVGRLGVPENAGGHPALRGRMAAELRARQPQLSHRGDRLHRRAAPVGVLRRRRWPPHFRGQAQVLVRHRGLYERRVDMIREQELLLR